MKLTEEQRGTANEFKQFIESATWKSLEKMADVQCEASMKNQDKTPAENLNINKVCEERGFRNGIRWLIQQARTKAEIG